MILHFSYSGLSRAIGATIEGLIRLDAVADDPATTVIANRGELVNRTLEAVEGMTSASSDNFKGQIIVVTTHLTLCHCKLSLLVNGGPILTHRVSDNRTPDFLMRSR